MNRSFQVASGHFALWLSPCVNDRMMTAGSGRTIVTGSSALWTVSHARDRIMAARAGAILVRISDQVTTSDDVAPPLPPDTRQIVCNADGGQFTMAGSDARLKPKKGPPQRTRR